MEKAADLGRRNGQLCIYIYIYDQRYTRRSGLCEDSGYAGGTWLSGEKSMHGDMRVVMGVW